MTNYRRKNDDLSITAVRAARKGDGEAMKEILCYYEGYLHLLGRVYETAFGAQAYLYHCYSRIMTMSIWWMKYLTLSQLNLPVAIGHFH